MRYIPIRECSGCPHHGHKGGFGPHQLGSAAKRNLQVLPPDCLAPMHPSSIRARLYFRL